MTNLNIPQTLVELIQKVSQNMTYSQVLEVFKDKYNICGTNINSLTPQKVLQTYSIIKKKFYYERKNPANCSWFQNELRIYIWVLVCYLYVNKKDILSLTFDDWSFFKPIFYNRDPILFEFQGILLLKTKTSKWEEEQIKLLDKIVKIKSLKNKWNSIARELYILSDKKFIKTPKQCRERWLNYLDPSKVHCPWTNQEDLILLTSIRDNGKRWAYTVKKLLKKRTEHMVKNRFNSLINIEKRRIGNKSQSQLLVSAVQTIKLSLCQQQKTKPLQKVQQNQKLSKFQIEDIEDEKQQYSELKIKKRSSSNKQINRKVQNKKIGENIASLPTMASLLTVSNLESNIQTPAEINKKKIQEENQHLEFLQLNESAMEFNPFQQYLPNSELMAPNFLYYSQVSQSNENHCKHESEEVEEIHDSNFQGNYHFT